MEVLSYILINIMVALFCALSVYFLKYQSIYVKTTTDSKEKENTDKKGNDTDEKEDVSAETDTSIEETEVRTETSEDTDVIKTDMFQDEKVSVKGEVTYKKLWSDNFTFVVSMIMLNLALGNALVAIYDNHIITDIKSMLIVTALWPIALIDFREKKIPNAILKVLVYFRVLILIPELILLDNSIKIFVSSAVAALAIFLASVAVGLLMKGSIGMGDVKLFIVLGLYLGLEGIWSSVFCSLIVSFFISVYLLSTKKAGRKDSIPFAPAIMIGTFLSVFLTGI